MSLLNLQQQLDEHQQLLVAYSGGLDSTVLLHQLVCLRQQLPGIHLRAIHIHHGLNAHADSWVNHCQQQCAEWQVLFKVVHVRLDTRGKGVEAAARDARYQAFLENLQPGEVLLTAQHQNDQCETLLLALKRGAVRPGFPGCQPAGSLDVTCICVLYWTFPGLNWKSGRQSIICDGSKMTAIRTNVMTAILFVRQ